MHPTDNTRAILPSELAHSEPFHVPCQARYQPNAGRVKPVVRPRPNSRQVERNIVEPRVLVFADTPNVFKSSQREYRGDFVPDYEEMLATAASRGLLVSAYALVNDGLPEHFAARFRRQGYRVLRSEGPDCDYRFVDQVVASHVKGDIFVICSGDRRYASVAGLLRAAGKYVIVSFYRASCSQELIEEADEYICFPMKQR